jgi:hypothetical protein
MAGAKKSKKLTFEIWSYDVWGNARDGFEVNDRSKVGKITVTAKRTTHNAGTPHEFSTYHPTDRQLARAANCTGCVFDYSDGSYEITLRRNGRPIGQLIPVDA